MKYLADNQLIPKDTCLRMIVGTDEEESWQCIRYYLDHAEILPQVSIVPDANFPLLYCEKDFLTLIFLLWNLWMKEQRYKLWN